jgi:putative flippase GtrA
MVDSPLSIKERWLEAPEKLRYILVGFGGVAIGWVIYNLLYIFLPLEHNVATTAWVIAYFIGVIRQHALHFWLTFSESTAKYLPSLARAFGAYSIGILVSTAANFQMNEVIGMNHQIAWIISICISLLFNFALLKRFVFTKSEAQPKIN